MEEGRELGWDNIDLMHSTSLETMSWEAVGAPFSPGEVTGIVANPDKELFIGTKKGELWKYTNSTRFSKISLPGLQNFTPLYAARNGTVWGSEITESGCNWVGNKGNYKSLA